MSSDCVESPGFTQIAGSSIASPEWNTGAVSASDGTCTGDSTAWAGPSVRSALGTAASTATSADRATTTLSRRARANDTSGFPRIHELDGTYVAAAGDGNESPRGVPWLSHRSEPPVG